MLQITYQKSDGTTFKKYRQTEPSYKIGERTSMGWILLNVEYEYNNQYYTKSQFNAILQKNKQAFIKKNQTVANLKKELKTFLYYFIAIVIVNFIKTLLGI